MATGSDDLARRLARFPRGALSYFDGGFAIAARLPTDARNTVLDIVVQNFRDGNRTLEGSALQPATGLSEEEATRLASSYSIFIGLLSEVNVSVEQLTDSAKEILFKEEHREIALQVASSIFERKQEITRVVERAQLAGEILPSYGALSLVVDFRFRVVEGQVGPSVPVAIAHLDTDTNEQQLWFQLNRNDVEDMLKVLKKCASDLEFAETLTLEKKV